MAHQLAGVTLPVSLRSDEAAGLPWLTTLAETLAAEFRRYCGNAWCELYAAESNVVKNVYTRDPRRGNFAHRDCPALYAWAESGRGSRHADGIKLMPLDVQLLWLPPDTSQERGLEWSNFWAALNAVVALNVENEEYSALTSPTALGEHLVDRLGLWSLTIRAATTIDIVLEGASTQRLTGHLWQLEAMAEVKHDPNYQAPTGDACTHITYLTGTDGDVPIYQSNLEPEPEP
jgi:hypothetical protein